MLQCHSYAYTYVQPCHCCTIIIIQNTMIFVSSPHAPPILASVSFRVVPPSSTAPSHNDAGQGAFEFRGQMIDRPLLLQAENALAVSQRAQDE